MTMLELPAQRLAIAHRQAVIVTGAIGASLVLYAAVVEVLRRALPAAVVSGQFDMLRLMQFAVAGVVVFTSTVLKAVLLRNPSGSAETRVARLLTASIVTSAFAEVPAVLGLVLFIQGRRTGDFYILLVVSAYMLLRHFPRREAWEAYVQRGGDAR